MTNSQVTGGGSGISADGKAVVRNSHASTNGLGPGTAGILASEAVITGSSVGGHIAAVNIGTGTLVSDTLTAVATALRIGGHVLCRDSRIVGTVDSFYGIEAIGSVSLTLRNTYVTGFDVGAYIAQDAVADIDSGCVLTQNDTGIEVYDSDYPLIRNSFITDNTTSGIYCHDGASVTIEGDSVAGNGLGVFCYWSSPTIQEQNVIEENTTGIRCDEHASPGIYRNKIAGNSNGVLASNESEPHLGGVCEEACDSLCTGGNKIIDNTYHISVQTQATIMAECNWWGTKKAPPASKFIGSVDYTPWLTADPLPNLSGRFAEYPEQNHGIVIGSFRGDKEGRIAIRADASASLGRIVFFTE